MPPASSCPWATPPPSRSGCAWCSRIPRSRRASGGRLASACASASPSTPWCGPTRRCTSRSAPMAEPLRILLVVDGRYPSTGGAEMQARLLARTFVAAGHDVRILVPRLDRSLPLEERIDGVPVLRLSYPRVRGLGALFLCARFCAWLLRHRADFDAIHVHMA